MGAHLAKKNPVRTQEKHKEIRMAFVRNNLPAKN
jgi:hypothetical protein